MVRLGDFAERLPALADALSQETAMRLLSIWLADGYDAGDLAKRMSELVGHDPPWTADYIRAVANGRMDAGAPLRTGIWAWGMVQSHPHPIKNALVEVTVLAKAGTIEEGAMVLRGSKPCRNCLEPFVPGPGNQDFCTVQCREAHTE